MTLIFRLTVVGFLLLVGCKVDSPRFGHEPLMPVTDGYGYSPHLPAGAIPATRVGSDANEVANVADIAATSMDSSRPTTQLPPPFPAFSKGLCPSLSAGINSFSTSTSLREVVIYYPVGNEPMPLLFLWHDSAQSLASFAEEVGAHAISQQFKAVVVMIGGRVALNPWDFISDAGAQEEVQLFYDVLACVSTQMPINRARVYSMGFGAGASWADRLMTEASDYLSAVALFNPEYAQHTAASRSIPVFLAWRDEGVRFDSFGAPHNHVDLGESLRDSLVADGHSVLACSHSFGADIPPDLVRGAFATVSGFQWADPPPGFGYTMGAPQGCALQ